MISSVQRGAGVGHYGGARGLCSGRLGAQQEGALSGLNDKGFAICMQHPEHPHCILRLESLQAGILGPGCVGFLHHSPSCLLSKVLPLLPTGLPP